MRSSGKGKKKRDSEQRRRHTLSEGDLDKFDKAFLRQQFELEKEKDPSRGKKTSDALKDKGKQVIPRFSKSGVDIQRTRPRGGSAPSSVPEKQDKSEEPPPNRVTKKDLASSGHDEMFNNRRKVAFESGLAGALFKYPGLFDEVVNPTIIDLANIIVPGIEEATSASTDRKSETLNSSIALFNALANDPNTLRAYKARQEKKDPSGFPLSEVAKVDITNQSQKKEFGTYIIGVLRTGLEPPATFEEKLTIIYNFADFMTRPHKFAKELTSDDPNSPTSKVNLKNLTPEQKKEMDEKWKRFKVNSGIPGLFDSTKEHASESRYPRIKKVDTNKSEGRSGLFPVGTKRPISPENPHAELVSELTTPAFYNISGVGLWQPGIAKSRTISSSSDIRDDVGSDLVNRERNFAYQAMYVYDMPLIGGASGGMGSYLLTFSVIGKIQQPKLQKAFLAAASVMIGKGYHSFHELAVVAKTFGIEYRLGDYFSAIPDELIERNEDIRKLALTFPELIFGSDLNNLLNAVQSIAYGYEINWDRQQKALLDKLNIWQTIYEKMDSEFRNEARNIYIKYLDEMGIDIDILKLLLKISAKQASTFRIANQPTVSLEVIQTVKINMQEIVSKVKNASSGNEIDLSQDVESLKHSIEQWIEDFNRISVRNVRARNYELDRINSLVEEEMGISMYDFNQFMSGSTTVVKA